MSAKQLKFTVRAHFYQIEHYLGWGKTDPCGSASSSKLMEAEVEVVSDAACESSTGLQQCIANPGTVGYSGQITDQMLCASATGGAKKVWWLRHNPFQGRMPAKATVAVPSLSRTVTNTIWRGWSAGAMAVPQTGCLASMLRWPSLGAGLMPL